MIKQELEKAIENGNLRAQLSNMRQTIKEDTSQAKSMATKDVLEIIVDSLKGDDPKTRKNAAGLLGDIASSITSDKENEVVDALWKAYEKEETLFVKSVYLKALKQFDFEAYLSQMQKRLEQLYENDFEESDLKHIRQERKELEEMTRMMVKNEPHHFIGLKKERDVLLVADTCIREILADQLKDQTLIVPLGVRVKTSHVESFLNNPLYRDALIYIPMKKGVVLDAKTGGITIAKSCLVQMLDEMHQEQQKPYYFRLQLKGKMSEDEKRKLTKNLACQIEEHSQRMLINAPSEYELGIYLFMRKDGTFAAFLKLHTWKANRFAYRKCVQPTSMSPVTAAEIVALCEPYLKENVQIIDPFCGVGTLLIERNQKKRAREIYGTDIFGNAIIGARENAKMLKLPINYINRDYFEFKHEYLFDEVITEFPNMYKNDREEIRDFYQKFFEKTEEITTKDAILILYTNEEDQIKKHIRLHNKYRLVKEIQMNKLYHLYIIKKG